MNLFGRGRPCQCSDPNVSTRNRPSVVASKQRMRLATQTLQIPEACVIHRRCPSLLVRLKRCGAPSKRPELSSLQKTVEDPAFVFGSRSGRAKRNRLMKWTAAKGSDVSTVGGGGYFARDVPRAGDHVCSVKPAHRTVFSSFSFFKPRLLLAENPLRFGNRAENVVK